MTSPSMVAQHIPLPSIDEELIRRTKGAEMQWSDSRRFPRKNAGGQCLLEPDSTYAESGYASATQDVLLCNLSRGGVRILHGGELFPGEMCLLTLRTGTRLRLEVVWCRRLERGIYVSGCYFNESRD
jgi:hypothetical protein